MRLLLVALTITAAVALAMPQNTDCGKGYPPQPCEEDEVVVGVTPIPEASILDQAVNYWTMDETGGTRVDIVGSDDLAENEPITSVAGKKGNAANFDANSHLLTSSSWRIIGASGFSISSWIRRDGNSDAYWVVEDQLTDSSFELRTRPPGDIAGLIRNDGGSLETLLSSGDSGVSSAWVHVLLSWNSGDNVRLFIDGVEEDISAGTLSGTFRDNSVGIRFGARANDLFPWSGATEGYIDEVAIWDVGIGESGAVELYAGGSGKFLP